MSSKKRNQIIGFITLVLLALILAPYILTNKSEQPRHSIPLLSVPLDEYITDSFPVIEEQMDFDNDNGTDISLIVREPVINDSLSMTTIAIESGSGEISNPPTIQNSSKYIIQLVALKNKAKIEELVALLRLNNYTVYTTPPTPVNDQLNRLFVGEYQTREQADVVIIDLEHLTKLKGIIVTK